MRSVGAISIEIIGFLIFTHEFGFKNTAVSNEPGNPASGVCATAKTEQKKFVAGRIVTNKKEVDILNISRYASSECSTGKVVPKPPARAHALMVVHNLRHPFGIFRTNRRSNFHYVGGIGHPLVRLLRFIPCSIRAHYCPLRHMSSWFLIFTRLRYKFPFPQRHTHITTCRPTL